MKPKQKLWKREMLRREPNRPFPLPSARPASTEPARPHRPRCPAASTTSPHRHKPSSPPPRGLDLIAGRNRARRPLCRHLFHPPPSNQRQRCCRFAQPASWGAPWPPPGPLLDLLSIPSTASAGRRPPASWRCGRMNAEARMRTRWYTGGLDGGGRWAGKGGSV